MRGPRFANQGKVNQYLQGYFLLNGVNPLHYNRADVVEGAVRDFPHELDLDPATERAFCRRVRIWDALRLLGHRPLQSPGARARRLVPRASQAGTAPEVTGSGGLLIAQTRDVFEHNCKHRLRNVRDCEESVKTDVRAWLAAHPAIHETAEEFMRRLWDGL
jgi:hypothetical protein